jgi:hypothetical protein
MVIKPTDFKEEERMGKELKRRRQIVIVIGILGWVFELVCVLLIVFLGIFLYNKIF